MIEGFVRRRRLSAIVPLLLALAIGPAAVAQAPAGIELALVDLDGARHVVGRLPRSTFAPRLSPDGTRIAFETRDPSGPDGGRLWIAELSDLAARRALPSTGAPLNWAPMWTPDGERLVFIESSQRGDAVYWRRADGTGAAEHLIDARSAEGWMPGGTHLRFLTLKASGGSLDYGISTFDMRARTAATIVDLPGTAQHSSAVSPDGRWLAYASNETGRYEVWLEPLPRTGARQQITRGGGGHPLWAPDGRSLYFDRDRRMFRLAIDTASPSSVGDPVALPITGFVQGEYRRQFELMPNGRQFLMLFPPPAP